MDAPREHASQLKSVELKTVTSAFATNIQNAIDLLFMPTVTTDIAVEQTATLAGWSTIAALAKTQGRTLPPEVLTELSTKLEETFASERMRTLLRGQADKVLTNMLGIDRFRDMARQLFAEGQRVPLDSCIASGFLNAAIVCGCELMAAVGQWLQANPAT